MPEAAFELPAFFLIVAVFFRLFGDQSMVIKIVDLHGSLYIVKGLGGNLSCGDAALLENVVDIGDSLLPFFSACSDGGKLFLQNVV